MLLESYITKMSSDEIIKRRAKAIKLLLQGIWPWPTEPVNWEEAFVTLSSGRIYLNHELDSPMLSDRQIRSILRNRAKKDNEE